MNPIDLFRYGNTYAQYKSGKTDPGDPAGNEKETITLPNGKTRKVKRRLTDSEKTNLSVDRNTLMLAKQIGPDLSLEEFRQLRNEVQQLHDKHASEDYTRSERGEFELELWAIPDRFRARRRSNNFSPSRNRDGTPNETSSVVGAVGSGIASAASFAPDFSPGDAISGLLSGSNSPQEGQSEPPPRKMNALDMLQMGLDAVGVADPTPIADGANAVLSVARAAFDPAHAGEHLKNAGISAISMVPYFGDIAKLFKYGGKAAKATGAAADAGHAANAAGHAAGGAGGNGGRGRGGMASTILGMFGGGAGGGGGSGGGSVGGGGIGGVPPGSSGGGDDFKSPVPQAASAFSDALMTFTQRMTPLAIVVGASVYGLKKFVDWLEKVGETSKRMIEENRNLSQWTGQLAYAYARLDRERLQREIEASRDMSGPLSRLTSAQSGLEQSQEDYMRPYKQLSADIQALLTVVANTGVQVIDAIDPINDILKMWYDQDKTDKTSRTAAEAVAKMASARAALRKL